VEYVALVRVRAGRGADWLSANPVALVIVMLNLSGGFLVL
jgi:hypothetical protein